MMKNFIVILSLLLPLNIYAQIIKGEVIDEKDQPLIGANVHWANTTIGATTDSNGEFKLSLDKSSGVLVASYVGYLTDSIAVHDQTFVTFRLKEHESLGQVTIQGQRDGVIISDLEPIKYEQITQTELGKAACCDLAGCFETQTTVQPQTTNVLTNSKELRILGLSGVYNQVLIDGFPMIQGLTYTYGISSIPGTLVDNIFISKGANSVLQGFESMSGQINVETKEPDDTEKILLNAYINNFSERHFNANVATGKGKWSNLVTFHTVQPAKEFDGDNDGFLDLPKLTRYAVSNKLKYGQEKDWGWSSRIGLRYVDEERVGGQINFNEVNDKGSDEVYGQTINFKQPEIWTKTGYRLNDKHNVVLFASSFYQDQESYFGAVLYEANQLNVYGNLQYEFNYKGNSLKTGLSYRYLNLDESIQFLSNDLGRTYDGIYTRKERIAGAFAENTLFLLEDKLTWIVGIRLDDHNQFGTELTPRTLLKLDITPKTILRANLGTGWRTVNLFTENINLLASSRDIVFREQLQPEKSINSGINLTQKYKRGNLDGFVSLDIYRTEFQNQIFPDYDEDPSMAIIENFDGKSVSNVMQAEVYVSFKQRIEFKTGYSFLDVYRMIDGEKVLLPFNPRHKIVSTLGYKARSEKYHIDMNIHWYGEQRLPDTQDNPVEYQRPEFSESYALVNGQVTFNVNRFEIYGGCENIFNFRQIRPIIGWQEPFGEYFDTSSVWGPTRGREMYLGVRFKVGS